MLTDYTGDHAGRSCSQQVQEAHKQIEEALQAAEQQVAALRGRVSKKHSQLADARHQLDVTRGELCDVCASQHRAPPSLPDTESSDQTGTNSNKAHGLSVYWKLVYVSWGQSVHELLPAFSKQTHPSLLICGVSACAAGLFHKHVFPLRMVFWKLSCTAMHAHTCTANFCSRTNIHDHAVTSSCVPLQTLQQQRSNC